MMYNELTNNPQRISFRDWMCEKYLPFYDPEDAHCQDYETGDGYVLLAHDMERTHCSVATDNLMDYVEHLTFGGFGPTDPLVLGILVKAFMQYRMEPVFEALYAEQTAQKI